MQGPGSEVTRHSASPPSSDRSGSTRPTCAMSQVGRARFTIGARMHERTGASAPSVPARMEPLIENRWSGRNTQHMHHMQDRGASSAGVTWCNEQRRTRLPLLGASAVASRRRRATHAGKSYVAAPPARARCRTHLASEAR